MSASRLQSKSRTTSSDLDVRTPQVSIKAKIILVNRTNIEDIGVSYDFGSNGTFFNSLMQRTDPSTFKPVDSNGDGVPDAVSGTPYNKAQQVIEIGGNSLAAVSNATARVVNPALSLIFSTALGKFNLTSFLDALQEVRLADVQAEPSIVTLDNRKAEIISGEETPIRIIDIGSLRPGWDAGHGAARNGELQGDRYHPHGHAAHHEQPQDPHDAARRALAAPAGRVRPRLHVPQAARGQRAPRRRRRDGRHRRAHRHLT